MTIDWKSQQFEAARPQLMGIAYRLLGSIADAEDAVQDVAYKWFAAPGPPPERPAAWLASVCTNRCLDVLKSAQRQRLDYVGPWLPEQFESEAVPDAEEALEIASSLTTAFLLLLERLTPRERAAYLLHDIFDMPHDDVAAALGIEPANCRKLASRARRLVSEENVRYLPSVARQEELLTRFQMAIATGDLTDLAGVLSEDVELRADGGGKVVAVRHVLAGQAVVSRFIGTTLANGWSGAEYEHRTINGMPALLVRIGDVLHAMTSFSYGADGTIQSVFIQRHPDKLGAALEKTRQVGRNGGLSYS